MSCLYVVATPIGNLEDITYRAVKILSEVDVIACESIDHSMKLLNHYNIKKKLISHNSSNEKNSASGILSLIKNGKTVAYISDAGTPSISDPVGYLINILRDEDIDIIPIPGPSAVISVLSVAGQVKNFFFEGFLANKGNKRKTRLEELKDYDTAIVLYESPNRVKKLFQEIQDVFGESIEILVAREITKKFEEILKKNIKFFINKYNDIEPKGEFAILIYPLKKEKRININKYKIES